MQVASFDADGTRPWTSQNSPTEAQRRRTNLGVICGSQKTAIFDTTGQAAPKRDL